MRGCSPDLKIKNIHRLKRDDALLCFLICFTQETLSPALSSDALFTKELLSQHLLSAVRRSCF